MEFGRKITVNAPFYMHLGLRYILENAQCAENIFIRNSTIFPCLFFKIEMRNIIIIIFY